VSASNRLERTGRSAYPTPGHWLDHADSPEIVTPISHGVTKSLVASTDVAAKGRARALSLGGRVDLPGTFTQEVPGTHFAISIQGIPW